MDDDDHYLIAIEHYLWCRKQDMTPRQVLEALGFPAPRHTVSDQLVVDALTMVHRSLFHRDAAA